jgi:hypothetical protein
MSTHREEAVVDTNLWNIQDFSEDSAENSFLHG